MLNNTTPTTWTLATITIAAALGLLIYLYRRRRRDTSDAIAITTAAPSLSDAQRSRTRRYLISMGIRTGCVLGAIVTPGWPRWALIAGAVALPYLAVVAANTPHDRRHHGSTPTVQPSTSETTPRPIPIGK